MLKLENVYMDYYDFGFELKDVSFELDEGFIMGLVGPNGSGKTTIINLIMNILKARKGKIEIFGLENSIDNNLAIKEKIGFVFDETIYPKSLNMEKLIFIYKNLYPEFDEKYLNELIARLNINTSKKLKDQSKGNIMKCQIALALSHKAKLILMDEPAAGLDPIIRRELLNILRDYRDKYQASILFSSHITEDLEEIADYITFIQDGKIIFSKDIESLRDEYKIVKSTIEESKNFDKDLFHGFEENEFYFSGLIKKSNLDKFDKAKSKDASIQDMMYYFYRK